MDILVLNSGSSSLKYQLFNMNNNEVVAKGLVERIGLKDGILSHKAGDKEKSLNQDIPNHKAALKLVLDLLVDKEVGVLKSLDELNGIGHRVVHGGEAFSKSVLITKDVEKAISDCIPLAPLHNPANLDGIKAVDEIMPNKPQVAVFDTAFHQTMKKDHYLYAIPYEHYDKYKVRRYGFHGTSHKYVSQRCAEFLNIDSSKLKVITVHIGNGGSIAAINGGNVVETTMGFTPLAGLMMGTRCGDIDPAIVFYMMKTENLSVQDIDNMLNKKSGLLGVSGVSSDMRDVENAAAQGNERAQVALDMYANRIMHFIGAYTAMLNGVDAIVFTAGVGENGISMRKKITEKLGWLGVKLDEEKNNCRGKEVIISTADSKVKVCVIPTNEEFMIANDTYEIIKNGKK